MVYLTPSSRAGWWSTCIQIRHKAAFHQALHLLASATTASGDYLAVGCEGAMQLRCQSSHAWHRKCAQALQGIQDSSSPQGARCAPATHMQQLQHCFKGWLHQAAGWRCGSNERPPAQSPTHSQRARNHSCCRTRHTCASQLTQAGMPHIQQPALSPRSRQQPMQRRLTRGGGSTMSTWCACGTPGNHAWPLLVAGDAAVPV